MKFEKSNFDSIETEKLIQNKKRFEKFEENHTCGKKKSTKSKKGFKKIQIGGKGDNE